ncbi:MAG TPA: hypothetical protein VEH30_15105 [Terriglobales bacterium]|nr:hypothetical protein [Terriglobales bacterium]
MGADQSAGTLRSWRELYKAALFLVIVADAIFTTIFYFVGKA